MKKSISVFLFVFSLISTASAQQKSDQLLWSCTGAAQGEAEAMVGKIYCVAYISGIIDSYRLLSDVNKDIRFICLPKQGISNDQAMRVVVNWLERNPKELHNPARLSVFDALREAFPCN